jgi:cellulose biosynthesis protein BcsQ
MLRNERVLAVDLDPSANLVLILLLAGGVSNVLPTGTKGGLEQTAIQGQSSKRRQGALFESGHPERVATM